MFSIGFATSEEIRQRTIDIASGKHKPSKLEPKIWFSSISSMLKVLLDNGHEVTKSIRRHRLNLGEQDEKQETKHPKA